MKPWSDGWQGFADRKTEQCKNKQVKRSCDDDCDEDFDKGIVSIFSNSSVLSVCFGSGICTLCILVIINKKVIC